MCFNVTVGPFVLTCCPNGTLLPELGVWTAERAPECGEVQGESGGEWQIVLYLSLLIVLFCVIRGILTCILFRN